MPSRMAVTLATSDDRVVTGVGLDQRNDVGVGAGDPHRDSLVDAGHDDPERRLPDAAQQFGGEDDGRLTSGMTA